MADEHIAIGKWRVNVHHGLLWDTVEVRYDVWPAAGGQVGYKHVWRGRTGDAKANKLAWRCVQALEGDAGQ